MARWSGRRGTRIVVFVLLWPSLAHCFNHITFIPRRLITAAVIFDKGWLDVTMLDSLFLLSATVARQKLQVADCACAEVT